ncbi:hypothetical protein F5B22DRAFT_342576 [Xylaria bambusicola]|uniref:uncharacterized protein n=1 Tax=Xylaria bambusicola TaxID=326684 RepID=UPI002008886E|nr:uncharacterized protein F5B22DRAFT_342576 [Xylaria bambusicola]KAI0525458.1 hypothetical protein F5B22DRAFT_342576 [Xylaria bambusicola]
MADYASLKVPELKKLLQEKQLPVTGNKADLIARLQEHDKAKEEPKSTAAPVSAEEDPIDYSDDDVLASKPGPTKESAPAAEKVAESTAPVTGSSAESSAPSGEDKPAETTADETKPVETEAEADSKAAPKADFSAHLPASTADDEARKRAERAKRFGIVEDADEEAKKKAERAKRFGVDQSTIVSGLDSALPEKRERERKRGREGASNANADGERGAKRQQNAPGRHRGGRDNRNRGGRRGDRDSSRKDGGGKPRGVLNDPAERAKAEARAKRFGGQ